MNELCICKHYYLDHVWKADWNRYQCQTCMINAFVNGYFVHGSFPSFHTFAADNLIYLENKSSGL